MKGFNTTNIFKQSPFPAGETQIVQQKTIADLEHCFFVVRGDEALDLMGIAQKVDILRRAGVQNISIYIPYLPYSRQDRYTTNTSSFALKQYAKFINSLGFHGVYTLDAHSDVAGVIDSLVDISPAEVPPTI